jgi:hypothetical protein
VPTDQEPTAFLVVPQAEDEKLLVEFDELLMAVPYMSIFYTCQATEGLGELAAKVSVTLLRYSAVLPTDKLFYLAGTACKDQNHKNLAFILLNRCVPCGRCARVRPVAC